MGAKLRVRVCYAIPGREILLDLAVEEGCTVEGAIAASGLLAQVPDIALATQPVGVFGKKKSLDAPVRDGDRIEVYRPLQADPKESRRRRAEKKGPPA